MRLNREGGILADDTKKKNAPDCSFAGTGLKWMGRGELVGRPEKRPKPFGSR